MGHRPMDSCLSRHVSQGHLAGVPWIFLSLCASFLPEKEVIIVSMSACIESAKFYRRELGVGVKGVTGRDAIVHRRRRDNSQKKNKNSHKRLVPGTYSCFSGG